MILQATPVINKIAKHISGGSAFAYYAFDDIFQEIWGMCLEALLRFDPERGKLEHFLRSHVIRRLKNLRRDKYFRPDPKPVTEPSSMHQRMNLINALPLYGGDVPAGARILAGSSPPIDPSLIAESHEIEDILKTNLKPEYYHTLKSYMRGDRVTDQAMSKMREEARLILGIEEDEE